MVNLVIFYIQFVPHQKKFTIQMNIRNKFHYLSEDWYDTKQSDGEAPLMLVALGNAKYHFIAIVPRSTLTRSGSTW